MLKETLLEIFERDLLQLKTEIESYTDEKKLWVTREGISNSAGNLCLHLVGNLNHFIGAMLGQTGYVRKRYLEFSSKNIPQKDLVKNIIETKEMVHAVLSKLADVDLWRNFPQEMHEKIVTTDFMLLHLLTHFSYHLGQVNYLRRMSQ